MSKPSFISRYFAFLERRSLGDRWLLGIGIIITIASIFTVLVQYNNSHVVVTPTQGGSLTEGILGTPRFINPVLAITRADHDVVALVYSGLMKITADGSLAPDVAESIERSEDGRTYTITLADDVFFHDGQRLTSRDVVFTIGLIQDPNLKSPLLSNWDGVVAEAIDEQTLTLTLREPYAPFIDNFTVGILPQHIWGSIPIEQIPFSQHNTEPVGSGTYQIDTVARNSAGLIEGYTLTASPYARTIPNIPTVAMKFYTDAAVLTEALRNKDITATQSLHPRDVSDFIEDLTILEEPMSRTFGVFYNQNRSLVLRDDVVREALAVAIDREALIEQALHGYGIATTYPIPDTFIATTTPPGVQSTSSLSRSQQAEQILLEGGWEQQDDNTWVKEIDEEPVPLEITISTVNTDAFGLTAEYLRQTWEELGIPVRVEQFEQTDFVQSVVRPRNFSVLLFGSDVGRSLDLYPFWHSSQKDDPGLNITRYTNIDADSLLEQIRVTDNQAEREAAVLELFTLLDEEQPALFLYAPALTYLHHTELTIPNPVQQITAAHERFATISSWHIATERLWPMFTND